MNWQIPTQYRLRRLAQGLRLRDLEHRTGIPESSLSRIERGEQKPTFRQLERLGRALGIDAVQVRHDLQARGFESLESVSSGEDALQYKRAAGLQTGRPERS